MIAYSREKQSYKEITGDRTTADVLPQGCDDTVWMLTENTVRGAPVLLLGEGRVVRPT